jgi:hypothetical protein
MLENFILYAVWMFAALMSMDNIKRTPILVAIAIVVTIILKLI